MLQICIGFRYLIIAQARLSGLAVTAGVFQFVGGLGQGNEVPLSQPTNKLGSTQETETPPSRLKVAARWDSFVFVEPLHPK